MNEVNEVVFIEVGFIEEDIFSGEKQKVRKVAYVTNEQAIDNIMGALIKELRRADPTIGVHNITGFNLINTGYVENLKK